MDETTRIVIIIVVTVVIMVIGYLLKQRLGSHRAGNESARAQKT